ncbi:MAG TPA: alpha/beta hydrolase [Micropepsaceae bacterium]|nr:alpha/beta hydrolase [Micropepsaceae bacterium]
MENRFIQSGGARLHVAQFGAHMSPSAVPVLFLHAGVCDSRMWGVNARLLAMSRRVAAFDRRGFGQTQSPDEPFDAVSDVTAVMDGLGMERAVLVGCSMGGMVALDVAVTHPSRVAGLVLINAAVSGATEPDDSAHQPRSLLAALEAAGRARDLDRINELEAQLWLDGPFEAPGRVSGAARALFLDMNAKVLAHPPLTQERPPPGAYAHLGALKIPALVLTSPLDLWVMQRISETIAASIPGAELKALPGTAHLPSLEAPSLLQPILDEFIGRIR